MTDAEARNHNWECECGHTNWAISRVCHECMTHRKRGEVFRHMGGPRWMRWTRENGAGKALNGTVAA